MCRSVPQSPHANGRTTTCVAWGRGSARSSTRTRRMPSRTKDRTASLWQTCFGSADDKHPLRDDLVTSHFHELDPTLTEIP